ncbi:hypothetical protein HDZ31DRAFT_38104 [Schizophyllum fasciatum]
MPENGSDPDAPWRCPNDVEDETPSPQEKSAAGKHKAAHRPTLIHALPPELLEIIFQHAVGDRPLGLVRDDHPVWTLLETCRLWHDVARDLHALWTRIDTAKISKSAFSFVALTDEKMDEICTLLKSYLVYSHDQPLHLQLELRSDPRWTHVLDILWEHRHRWATVDCAGGSLEGIAEVLAKGDASGLPALRRLRWDTLFSDAIPSPLRFVPAPKLRSLTLGGGVRPSRLSLPWSQITHYTGPGISCRNTLILSLMDRLEVCVLQGNGRRHGTEDLSVHVLPRLRALGLAWHHPQSCLPYIEAPAVRKVLVDAPEFTLPGALFSFLQRSGGASLATLSMYYDVSPVSTYNIIQACPNLRTLILRQSPEFAVDDSVVHLFTLLTSPRPALLTQLAVLKIAPAPVLSDEDEEEEIERAMHLAKYLAALRPRRLQAVHLYVGDVRGTRLLLGERYKELTADANITVHATAHLHSADDFEELVRAVFYPNYVGIADWH